MTEKEIMQQQIQQLESQIYYAKIDLYVLKQQYIEKFPEDIPIEPILLDPPKKKRGRPKKIKEGDV